MKFILLASNLLNEVKNRKDFVIERLVRLGRSNGPCALPFENFLITRNVLAKRQM